MSREGKTVEEILTFLQDWFERLDIYITAFSFEFIKNREESAVLPVLSGKRWGFVRLFRSDRVR